MCFFFREIALFCLWQVSQGISPACHCALEHFVSTADARQNKPQRRSETGDILIYLSSWKYILIPTGTKNPIRFPSSAEAQKTKDALPVCILVISVLHIRKIIAFTIYHASMEQRFFSPLTLWQRYYFLCSTCRYMIYVTASTHFHVLWVIYIFISLLIQNALCLFPP